MSPSLPEKLERHIRQHALLGREQTYLLAFSGGLDSTVLGECLFRLGYQLEIAHVNYGLRGSESDRDEAFAQNWASTHKQPFHLLRAAGHDWQKSGHSLQENARNLRYNWFGQLLKERSLGAILTAHQADDQVETLVQRYFRGAGSKGLSGIPAQQADCIRPLLPFSRNEIEAFARAQNLSWAEDSSNARSDYQRNQIRHELLPLLDRLFPGFRQPMLRNAERMRELETFLASQSLPFLVENPFVQKLNRAEILQKNLQALLSRHLEALGFSWEATQEINHLPTSTESRSWQCGPVLVERKAGFIWIWTGPDLRPDPEIWTDRQQSMPESWSDWGIDMVEFPVPEIEPDVLVLSEELVFPLRLRRPAKGDKFRPAGMRGRRDLSDVLSEAGLSPEERRRWPILCDGNGEIIWIPGIRSGLTIGESSMGMVLRFRYQGNR